MCTEVIRTQDPITQSPESSVQLHRPLENQFSCSCLVIGDHFNLASNSLHELNTFTATYHHSSALHSNPCPHNSAGVLRNRHQDLHCIRHRVSSGSMSRGRQAQSGECHLALSALTSQPVHVFRASASATSYHNRAGRISRLPLSRLFILFSVQTNPRALRSLPFSRLPENQGNRQNGDVTMFRTILCLFSCYPPRNEFQ